MTQYDNRNRGALFKNAEKQDPKHADYNGNINVDGVEYWLNAWIRESKNGTKYLSVSVKAKRERGVAKSSADVPFDDAVPF
jgi:hypothetical protein